MLLLDQIDMTLDLISQKIFFTKTIYNLAKIFQVIIVSSSIFSLEHTIIDLDNTFKYLKKII